MKTYFVTGYDKRTGQKVTREIEGETVKHARSKAYQTMTRPHVLRRVRSRRGGS